MVPKNPSKDLRKEPPFGPASELVYKYSSKVHFVQETFDEPEILVISHNPHPAETRWLDVHAMGFLVLFSVKKLFLAEFDTSNAVVHDLAYSMQQQSRALYFAGEITKEICGSPLDYYKHDIAIRGLISNAGKKSQTKATPGYVTGNIQFIPKADLVTITPDLN